MKVLLITEVPRHDSLAYYVRNCLASSDVSVSSIPIHPRLHGLKSINAIFLLTKLIRKPITRFTIKRISNEIARNGVFDYVILFQTLLVKHDLLADFCRGVGVKTLFLFTDSPILLAEKFNRYFNELITFYDCYGVFCSRHENVLRALRISRVLKLEFGVSVNIFHSRYSDARKNIINYVGTYSQLVYLELKKLSMRHHVRVFGNGWNRTEFHHSDINKTGSELAAHIPSGSIVVNWFKPEHFSGISMKPFELLAMGVVLIQQRSTELDSIKNLVEGQHLYKFSNTEELLTTLDSILYKEDVRLAMSKNAEKVSRYFGYDNLWLPKLK